MLIDWPPIAFRQEETPAMKDVIRTVLVDPGNKSRDELRQALSAVPSIWLAEVFTSYQNVVERVKELSAHLAVVALDHDPVAAIELIQALSQANPEAVILPASASTDSALILKSIRAGAREFLTLPPDSVELPATVSRLFRGRELAEAADPNAHQIITVTGATGGVGSTSVAVNLAACLAAGKKHETILVDLDLLFGSVDALLDVPANQTLLDLMQKFERLDLTLLKRSMARHNSGLYVLPHPPELEDAARIDAEMFSRVLGMMKAAFNTVVIDASKALTACDMVAYDMSDQIVVVTQLDLLCVRNTARLLSLFQQTDRLAERVHLLVNRTGSLDAEIGAKNAEETLKKPITWQVPNMSRAFQLARVKGAPLGDVAHGCRAHQVFMEMARTLRPEPLEEAPAPKKSMFAALFF